jgi:hypothetical protein
MLTLHGDLLLMRVPLRPHIQGAEKQPGRLEAFSMCAYDSFISNILNVYIFAIH